MDRFEQLTTIPLISKSGIVACVEYQICDRCGFRLMRVETTIINGQHIEARHCPICHHSRKNLSDDMSAIFSDHEILMNFTTWLATHGLDLETLEKHYHLKMQDFFDLI